MFKADDTIGSSSIKPFIVAMCYIALFLGMNAAANSFMLVDHLSELGIEAAKRKAKQLSMHSTWGPLYPGSSIKLLVDYGAGHLFQLSLMSCE